MPTVIVVMGPNGCGKGYRISKAKEVIPNLVSISTGKLIREAGIDTSNGGLVDDEIVIGLLKRALDAIEDDDATIILDGVPRTIEQAELIKQAGIKIDRVISLILPVSDALKRASDRLVCSNVSCQETYTRSHFNAPKKAGICDKCGCALTTRKDDEPETVLKRFKIYREETHPLVVYYGSENVPVISLDSDEDKINDFITAVKS